MAGFVICDLYGCFSVKLLLVLLHLFFVRERVDLLKAVL